MTMKLQFYSQIITKKKVFDVAEASWLIEMFPNVVGNLSKGYENGPNNICIWMRFFPSYDLVLSGGCTYLLNKVVFVMQLCYAGYFIKKDLFLKFYIQ